MKLLDERMGIRLKTREYPVTSTGLTLLDEVLLGGFRKESIIHFYGDPGSGKTTFAMQIMANIMKQGWRGLWVDCNGAFSLDRFLQIIGDTESLNSLIHVRPQSFQHQTQVIQQIKHLLDRLGVIVVDPITHYYRANWYREGSQGFFQELISSQLASLAGLAQLQKIPVIVINYATRNQHGQSVPLTARGFNRFERYRFAFTILEDYAMKDGSEDSPLQQVEIELAPEKYSQRRKIIFSISINGIEVERVKN